jgi:hypothetical protein
MGGHVNSTSEARTRRPQRRPALAALGAVALTLAMTGQVAAAPRVSTSTTFAGYTLAPPLGLESVSTTLKVPALTCTGGLGYSQEVGEFTDTTISVVSEFCATGDIPAYSIFVYNGVDFASIPVNPGDDIDLDAFQTNSTSQTAQQVYAHDLTTGKSVSVSYFAQAFATVKFGSLGEGSAGVPTFKKATFTQPRVNGDFLGFWIPAPTEDNEVDSSGLTLISTGAFKVSTESFALTYKRGS